jgi:hypothetical protein
LIGAGNDRDNSFSSDHTGNLFQNCTTINGE